MKPVEWLELAGIVVAVITPMLVTAILFDIYYSNPTQMQYFVGQLTAICVGFASIAIAHKITHTEK